MKPKIKTTQSAIKTISKHLKYDPVLSKTVNAAGVSFAAIRARAKSGKITICADDMPEKVIDLAKEIKCYGATIGKVINTLERSEAKYAAKDALQQMTDSTTAVIWINIDGVGTVFCKEHHVLTFTDAKSERLGGIVKLLCA